MKALVLIPFMDKVTKEVHKTGDKIDISVDRFNEIIKKGNYIEAVEEPEKEEAVKG